MWVHREGAGCPCKECAERHLRCHSDCERYKKWADNFHKEYEKYRKRNDIENYDAHREMFKDHRFPRKHYIWKK